MSEEILKAIAQLFAIISKQDDGVEESEREFTISLLRQYVSEEICQEYIQIFDKKSDYLKKKEQENSNEDNTETEEKPKKKRKLTSVGDSVRILGISKKINKTLTQKQKVIVLVRLFELVNSNKKFTEQRMAIISTVAEVFNISEQEVIDIEQFVIKEKIEEINSINIVKIDNTISTTEQVSVEDLNIASILFLKIESTDQYFIRYFGNNSVSINGLLVNSTRINIFANGSSLRLSKGKPIYYSDVVSKFLSNKDDTKLSFNAENIEFKFPNKVKGLRDVNIKENQGTLFAIMGASGAGKTTLLNVLSGRSKPSSGKIEINGLDLVQDKKDLEGVIGYIPQDDLLVEELTVFQNLYFNAKLCFGNKSKRELTKMVNKTLKSLGLYERKDLKVGNPLNKLISGGQRKRLNIALELIREPSILFVDEPTSGLSSRDSENVMDLLRELSLKGKLIFVVIHQPSSDIYKMFDKVIILDTGGYQIYYGNPVEAVMYFKKIDAQVNSDIGECSICGNVNSELIFNIIESRVVNEHGQYLDDRKIKPEEWAEYYKKNHVNGSFEEVKDKPEKTLKLPNWFIQLGIYVKRDLLSKISNTQYIVLNMLEAPILAIILSYIIRYIADPNSTYYIFRENENIPPYIFMSIVVALFLGLTVSAEEIFRDRKILERESFLNLSRSSYLISKVFILFMISAIQTGMFAFIGNYILGIKDMSMFYWIALFTTSTFANMLGLNISSTFNSAVTIYIIIPLILIPQMILGGAMFSFDKLNRDISSIDRVPLTAEIMTSKWVYEALMVHQFKDNEFEKYFYDLEKGMSNANFMQVYLIPELKEKLDFCIENIEIDKKEIKTEVESNFRMIIHEILKQKKVFNKNIDFLFLKKLNRESLDTYTAYMTKSYLNELNDYYGKEFHKYYSRKEARVNHIVDKTPLLYKLKKDTYFNESVSDIVKKVFERNKIIQYNDRLIRQVDLIYLDPTPRNYFDFRSHFYAPKKYFAGKFYDTFWFNLFVVWFLTLVLYITLYFNIFKKIVGFDYKFYKKLKLKL